MIETPNPIALLPAGVGLTHLRVYDTLAPDGLLGGSAHFHFVCTECYYAISGRGRVQTLSAQGYREFPLETSGIVWFSPGTIHRLINDGDLEILVVMQNAGLPEAGDFVLTMPDHILLDTEKYFDAASLSPQGEVFASGEAAAYRRRDLAVQGFNELRERFDRGGDAVLQNFYESAARLIATKKDHWRTVYENGPLRATTATQQQLSALQNGDVSHLMDGSAHALAALGPNRKFGMCGTLGTYLPEGVTVAASTMPVSE
jgi:mannose-6-phosphate isomerase-like protein (cupin superfamily)